MNRLQHLYYLTSIGERMYFRTMLVVACLLTGWTLASAQVAPAATCEYTLELTDAGADGWDGAYIEVSLDNNTAVNHTVAGGSGSNLISIPASHGSKIDLYYHGAAFENQHAFTLYDANGTIIYADGPSPAEGAVSTIEVNCPETCTSAENYVILITVGDFPEEMSWELVNANGARVAYANANTYTGLPTGTQIPVAVTLSSCEGYTFRAFDGFNDGWDNGAWQILSLNANRGSALVDPVYSGYFEVASGPGAFIDEAVQTLTLPCLECPEDRVEVTTTDCELPAYVYPAADLPTPTICYPDYNGHGTPAPTLTISYPTAVPAVVAAPTSTAANLPVGINPAIFEATYNDGQVVRCTSNVLVVSSMNPTLICNDNVIMSLNEPDDIDNDQSGALNDDLGECVLAITPDMVLEMPGFCEGEFTVTILDDDGNELSNLIGPDMIGQTVMYRVNHIASSNLCWGTITIEDKLAPSIECQDYTIACNHPNALDENFIQTQVLAPMEGTLPANIAGGASFPAPPSVTTLGFDVGCAPLGEYLHNVTVDLTISHTDVGDLEILLVDPLGNTYTLMNAGNCAAGAGQDMNVTFSSTVDAPSITGACTSGTIDGTFAPVDNLMFNLPFSPYGGTWQVVINDGNNTTFPDGEVGLGEVVDAQLTFVSGFAIPVTAYDCSDFEFNLLSETIVETNCAEPWIGSEIRRVWRATDASGNISTCMQTVKLRTPTFDDIVIPADLSLPCGSSTDIEDTGVPTFDCFDLNDDYNGLCDISYTYTDTEIPTCGEGKKLIREWTLVNWCSSSTQEFSQVIKVEDKEGPVISAEDITTSAATYSCDADIQFSALVEDNCSGVSQITASYVAGGGGYNALSGSLYIIDITNTGIIEDLPEGETEVLITAQDGCGNTSMDTIMITVIDDVAPAAICDDDLHITLNGGGNARIYAEDIDEGSFDNCGIESLEVRRVNGCLGVSEFAEYVDFDCCDIGEPVTVELRVTDFNGNSSLCWLPIQLEDKLPPIITCPTDKTINCDESFGSLSQFGDANAIDNCEVEIETTETQDIDNCGAGTITRTWTATDPTGNQNTCTQRIVLNHVSDFAVQFPADVTITSCTDDVGDTGEPLINDDDCELIATSFEDQIFDVVPDACFKIIRKWTVINWCTYDLNASNTNLGTELPTPRTYGDDGDGYFEYTQVIKVTDSEAPVIDESSVSDVEIGVVNGCSETYTAPQATATDDCAGDLVLDGFPSSVTGAPGDNLTISYTATDGCGNTDNYSINVTFVDQKAPTPVCINGLSVEIMSSGMIELWANDFEIGSSYDNCTEYEDLVFSFSSDTTDTSVTFTCADLGTQIVELWATDLAGNQAYCSTYVIIQDNMDSCGGSTDASVAISGLIQDESGRNVEEVTVEVTGSNAIPFMTGTSGNFTFPSIEMFGDYDVTPSKDMMPTNGVSTYDLVLISQHILGIADLDSPYKLIAADVNNDGTVTTFDMVELRQLILAIVSDFSNNTSWRFVNADFVFADPSNPFSSPFPEAIHFEDIDANELEADFVGIKIGDVNDSAEPNSLLGTEERNLMGTLSFALDNETTRKGETQRVDFRAKDFNNILGYQFTINFDETLEFVSVESGALSVSTDNFGLTMLNEGIITTSWSESKAISLQDDEVLFSLIFDAKTSTQLSDLITVSSRYTTAEAYNDASEMMDIELAFIDTNNETMVNGSFELYQNRPNPFNDETTIGFHLPTASEASLKIYDVSGKLLKVIQNNFSAGYNEIRVQKTELAATGVLYYTLETPSATATKKMIIVK